MKVKFFHPEGVTRDGAPVEYVSIAGDFMGKDEVVREATDDDRRRFGGEYAEFKAPAAEPEVKAEGSA